MWTNRGHCCSTKHIPESLLSCSLYFTVLESRLLQNVRMSFCHWNQFETTKKCIIHLFIVNECVRFTLVGGIICFNKISARFLQSETQVHLVSCVSLCLSWLLDVLYCLNMSSYSARNMREFTINKGIYSKRMIYNSRLYPAFTIVF